MYIIADLIAKKFTVMIKKLSFVLAFLVLSSVVFSQELLSTSGGSASNSEVQVSWSVGELMIETFVHPQIILTQGFQQSGYTISSIYEEDNIDFYIQAFPNPVKDRLTINWGEYSQEVEMRVYDAAGNIKNVIDMPSSIQSTEFDMSKFGVGTYLFCIFNKDGKLLKTVQIIKH